MTTPATLLTDAFSEAVAYWRANNGGTRAGLITDLVNTLGVSVATATKWVDAMTQQCYDQAMTDGPDYASFKSRLLAVGATRAFAGVSCAFAELRKGALIEDSRTETIAKFDERIAAVDVKIADTSSAISTIGAQAPSTERTTALKALSLYAVRLQAQRNILVVERDKLAATVGG